MSLSLILLLFNAIAWIVVGWVRVYHLMRYFQLEGYDRKRYDLWYSKSMAEKRYRRPVIVALAVAGAASLVAIFVLPRSLSVSNITYGLSVLGIILAGVLIALRPVDREIKQPFTPTQRATRLIVTGFLLVVVLQLPAVLIAFNNDTLGAHLIGLIAGMMSLYLVPHFLPLANVINWPIEEAFRRYYLNRARNLLRRSGAKVIAITGSYGKTTTKHYLYHILEGRFRVLMTPKSYNTLLGISRVINDVFAKDVSYEYFIAETDAYFVGENAMICRLVNPSISMVMTVGPMHLERLGSMENISKAQYEVIEALPPDGAGFFNGDDPVVLEMAKRGYPQMVQYVTQKGIPGARLEAINIEMTTEGLDFTIRDNQTGEQQAMRAPLYGEHNITNILMASAVAHYLGMSLAEIGLRVRTLQPAEHRLIRRVMPDGTVIIDDTYSANPVGTQTALRVLDLHQKSPRRVVVSSGMFELGAVSEAENRKLGERMAEVATDVILIGAEQTKPVKAGLDNRRFPTDHIHVVGSFKDAVTIYQQIMKPGDTLLLLTDLPDTYAS